MPKDQQVESPLAKMEKMVWDSLDPEPKDDEQEEEQEDEDEDSD